MQPPGFDLYAHMAQPPEGAVCPLCRGVGGVDRHPELVYVCRLCGGPRVPFVAGVPISEEVLGALAKADWVRKKRGGMRALSVAGWTGVAAGALLSLLVGFASWTWAGILALLIVAPSLAMALIGRGQRASAAKELAANLDAAWSTAAADAAGAGKVKSADDLRALFRIDAPRAQQLFNMLTVDAEVGGTGVRIDAGTGASVPADPRFAAIEARLAAEQGAEAEAEAEASNAQATRTQTKG